MWQETHKGLLNNGMLLATEVFFIALIATRISQRNSGLRALRVMYREVRESSSPNMQPSV